MRIVHSLFTNAVGGTERHLAQLANDQARHGHEVTVIIRGKREPYGLEVDPFLNWLSDQISIRHAPKCWPFDRWPLPFLASMLREIKPDIIHTHHGRDSRYLAKAAMGMCPVIGTLHMPYREKDFKRHNGIICVSDWQLPSVPKDEGKEVTVIPNWVKPPDAGKRHLRSTLRDELNLSAGESLIGAVGRLVPEKGMKELIIAFAKANLPMTRLCIIGEGEQRPLLEDIIMQYHLSNRVHLVGYRDDIRFCYDQFDLFAMPSRTEPFGLVLLEAMMAGCPVVTTRSEGPSDILSNNLQVIWAECHNADSLQEALQAAHPVMGERWVYHELGNHSLDRASRAVLRFYEGLIEKHQTAQTDESAVA